jgi:hypothetical protein
MKDIKFLSLFQAHSPLFRRDFGCRARQKNKLYFLLDSQPKKGYIINGWDGAMRQARPAEPGSAYAGPGDFFCS